MADKNTERFWQQLLDFIEDGRVIPVIGPELLLLDINGEKTLLYSYFTQQLAKRLHVSIEPEDTLDTVACRYLAEGGQREDIYPELKRVIPMLADIKLPDALLKLAEIKSFNLFVTTSFDPLLMHALNQVRYGGKENTQVLAFSPGSNYDLPVAAEQLDRATVFHLFGKVASVPEYAVTEEDVLEFMHALQSRTSRPERLFDALIKQNLVIVGCTLSDWLGRFFVRIGKKERLIISGGKTDYIVSDQLQHEKDLTEFLQHYSKRTKVFSVNSIEFVSELHRRWMELHPPSQTTMPDMPDNGLDKMQTGAVFLSYASEDRSTVILIRDALEQAGIDVWFDRNPDALHVGDNFETKIKNNIDHCSVFIAIISKNTLTPKRRFFRVEWNYAQQVDDFFPDNKHFILPVVIDDTAPDAPALPEKFRALHWEKFESGQTHPALLNRVKQLYRDHQIALAKSV